MARRRGRSLVVLGLLVLLAGCGALFGNGPTDDRPTVTPAEVPEADSRAVSTPDDGTGQAGSRTYWGNVSVSANRSAVTQPRYLRQRPTCERPPGLVIHIQVMALQNNDPATNEGINTTWQFAAPSNRDVTGPYPNFVRTITRAFQPLLNATAVRYGPIDREGTVASRNVTVAAENGSTTTYEWRVEKQNRSPFEGCWMTTSVGPA